MNKKTVEQIQKCRVCGETKPLTKENFFFRKDTNKYNTECRVCYKIRYSKYREDNKEKIAAREKEYYENNKEYILEYHKEYYQKNKENIAVYREENKDYIADRERKYRKENKEKVSYQQKNYRENNKEKKAAHKKEWRQENIEEIGAHYKEYREENKEKIKLKRKEYYNKNKEKELQNNKNWVRENSEKKKEISKRQYHRNKNNPNIIIHRMVRALLINSLKKNSVPKSDKTFIILGYTKQKVKHHIESQWIGSNAWMNWNNHGRYDPKTWDDNDPSTWTWNIDHIIPQSDLPYTSMEDENFKKCWALENLRPLNAKQNILDGVHRVRHRKK